MLRNWHEVSPQEPCTICGKPNWCSRSADGVRVACRRLDTGEGIHRVDKAGIDYWLYRLTSIYCADRPAIDVPVPLASERARPDTLNRVYRALLALLPLAPRHHQNLHHRGLSDQEIRRRQYRTLPAQRRAELAHRLIDAFGPEVCAQVPGFHVKQAEGRRWWSLAGAAGLLIPVCDLQRRFIALIVRSDDLEADLRYSSISSKKHGGPGPGAHIHVPLYESASTDTIRLTEGILKADVATALSGILTLGLPGVSAWRQAFPLLREIQPRTVVLAFDADAWRNWNVARALQRTAGALRAAGIQAVLERWSEEDGKGIDDLLGAGKRPEVIIGKAVPEAIREIVRTAYMSDPLLQQQRHTALQRRYSQQQRLPAVDPWFGPRAALQGIPLTVRQLGQEG